MRVSGAGAEGRCERVRVEKVLLAKIDHEIGRLVDLKMQDGETVDLGTCLAGRLLDSLNASLERRATERID